MSKQMTGGCQCGRVRYTARVADTDAYLCHCRMCQRATGGVSIAFKGLSKSDVTWDRPPAWYASSAIAKRPFCRDCGTPLGFAFDAGDDIDLTVGSFDNPASFRPVAHSGAESLHEAWIDTRSLPRHRSDDADGNVFSQWSAAGLKVPV